MDLEVIRKNRVSVGTCVIIYIGYNQENCQLTM